MEAPEILETLLRLQTEWTEMPQLKVGVMISGRGSFPFCFNSIAASTIARTCIA